MGYIMPTNLKPTSYLEPWRVVSEREYLLLRRLREVCAVLRHRDGDEVLHMRGVASEPFEIGEAGCIVRTLEEMGR